MRVTRETMTRPGALLISLLVPAIFFAVGLSNRLDYGETTDEKHDRHLGSCYLDVYPVSGHQGLLKCMDDLERNYGPLFDILAVSTHRFLLNKLRMGPDAGFHLPALIVSSLLIWTLFLFIWREAGLWPALLAAMGLALSPRFIAHSQANLKDIPTVFFFTLSLIQYQSLLKRPRLKSALLAGLFLGVTYCIKINALLVPAIVLIWILPRLRRMTLQHWGALALSGGVALTVIPITWPYYRQDFLHRFKETYDLFIAHDWVGYVLYLGQHYRGPDVPWHYPYVMLAVTTPLLLIIPALTILLWAAHAQVRGINPAGRNLVWRLATWALIPCLVQSASDAPMYDGIRHYLTSLPPLAALAGLGMAWAGQRAAALWPARPALGGTLYALTLAACFGDLLLSSVRLHPYQVVFYNALAGGPGGAYGRFDLDYWGFSYKEAGAWIARHAPRSSVIFVPYTVFQFPHNMDRHTTTSDPGVNWDYKVTLVRGMLRELDREDDYLYPALSPVYSVTAGGATLLRIFDNPTLRRLPPGTAIPALKPGARAVSTAFQVQEYYDKRLLRPGKTRPPQPRLGFDREDNPFKLRPIRVKFSAVLQVPTPGAYCFQVSVNDHAFLRINGRNVVAVLGGTRANQVWLDQGEYQVELDYYNQALEAYLDVRSGQGGCKDLSPVVAPFLVGSAAPDPGRGGPP